MMPPRAYLFMGLNGVRFLSIVSLLLVFSSSIFVLVNDIQAVNHFSSQSDASTQDCEYIEGSTVPNQPAGVFWAIVNRLFIIFQVIVLVLSEVGWPAAFFNHFFPVLGDSFGLGPIGIFQCLLGAAILSHHVDDFTLVSAFFLVAMGCLNMVLGLVFREGAKSRRSIMQWRAQAKGVLPNIHDPRPKFARPASSFVPALFKGNGEKTAEKESAGFGFGAQGEKAAGLKGFLISRPLESLPRYAPPPPRSETSRSSTPEPYFKSSGTAI